MDLGYLIQPQQQPEYLPAIRDLVLEYLGLLVRRKFVLDFTEFLRVLHARDVQMRIVLQQLTKLIATLARVEQITKTAGILNEEVKSVVEDYFLVDAYLL